MTVQEVAKRMGVDHLIGDEEVIQRVLAAISSGVPVAMTSPPPSRGCCCPQS